MDAYETSLATAALYIVIVVGCVIGFLVISAVRQHRQRVALQQQFLFEQACLLENERSRIARDLHDEVGALLWFALTLLEMKEDGGRGAENLEKAKVHLEKAIAQMGRIALHLQPVNALENGLGAALDELFKELRSTFPQQRFQLVCHLRTPLPVMRSLHLYRIVQEVVRNAVRHAGAGKVEVVLNEREGRLYLCCRDDGEGFDVAAAGRKNGMGLKSLRRRTELLGGNVSCTSAKGQGTTYFFSFPV
jgi:two-component system, NarL family, sensor kinase